MNFTPVSHDDLVKLAGRWLLNTKRCAVAITDMTSGAAETPDAIGWDGRLSILVECKASRADFLADAKKHFRRHPHNAMGWHRYFMAPDGMLAPDEIPEGWGLLGVVGSRVHVRKVSNGLPPSDRAYEINLLVSALRRMIAVPGVQGVNCRVYTIQTEGEPRAEVIGISEALGIDLQQNPNPADAEG